MGRDLAKSVQPSMSSWRELLIGRRTPAVALLLGRLQRQAGRVVTSRLSQLTIDAAIVAAALGLAYMIRFDGFPPAPYGHQLRLALPFVVSLYVGANIASGVYKRIWRFFGLNDAAAMAASVSVAFIVCFVWRVLDSGVFADTPVPFGVLAIHPLLAYTGLVEARLTRRILYEKAVARAQKGARGPRTRKRLLLIGAGEAGLHLLRELRDHFDVVGFLDDDIEIQRRTIGGWRVLGTTEDLEAVVAEYLVDEVVLCMPSASKPTLQRLSARCAQLPVKTSSVPTLGEIMSGKASLTQLTSVNMEALLGRDSVTYPRDLEELARSYAGRRILVTGAGGSIGSELVRQLREFKPSRLVLLDKDENNLYETACEIKEDFPEVSEVVADIRDLDVIERTFELHRPEVVFHAAAYKHVPLMEHHPAQAILNNVMGTRHLVDVSDAIRRRELRLHLHRQGGEPDQHDGRLEARRGADRAGPRIARDRHAVLLRAVRQRARQPGQRRAAFQRQIRSGRNITVTHPDVRRYFMTIPEAVQLVIQAGSLGKQGEIFLLDMGDPVKIVDLARNLIELSGLVPDKDVKIEFTGLRPGEKLNEELLIAGESGARSTEYSKNLRRGGAPAGSVAPGHRRARPGRRRAVRRREGAPRHAPRTEHRLSAAARRARRIPPRRGRGSEAGAAEGRGGASLGRRTGRLRENGSIKTHRSRCCRTGMPLPAPLKTRCSSRRRRACSTWTCRRSGAIGSCSTSSCWRDIKVRYKQTALGAAWAVLQPLADDGGVHASSSAAWRRFPPTACRTRSSRSRRSCRGRSSRTPLDAVASQPRRQLNADHEGLLPAARDAAGALVVPASSIFGLAFPLLVVLMLATTASRRPRRSLALPLFVLLALATALAVGALALGAERSVPRRAVRRSRSCIQFWMFATPVAYPASVRAGALALALRAQPDGRR